MNTYKKEILPLETERGSYYYYKEKLASLKQELEEFLAGPGQYMDDRTFAERFLGCQEIQANNSVEGYNDDALTIRAVIMDTYHHNLPDKRRKIINNLYEAYQMILEGQAITQENLKKLYNILSSGLLSQDDLAEMGPFYRNGEVEINFSGILGDEDFHLTNHGLGRYKDHGVTQELVSQYMDSLFSFLNNDGNLITPTDYFIKSQIAHYYFVYVHPYYDINGRSSRTLAMWYLINHEVYPYIIFNRAIPFSNRYYNQAIRDTKRFKNLTFFLQFMLSKVKIELEKEYLIRSVNEALPRALDDEEYQTLYYILSMKGLKTCKDFASFYNRLNDKKTMRDIDEQMLEPLIRKNVIEVIRKTSSYLYGEKANYVFELNDDMIDNDPQKIPRLRLQKK